MNPNVLAVLVLGVITGLLFYISGQLARILTCLERVEHKSDKQASREYVLPRVRSALATDCKHHPPCPPDTPRWVCENLDVTTGE